MQLRAVRVIGLVLLVALALPRASYGADTKLTAKEHYKKGVSFYALGKYSEAATEYEAAFEIEPDPALLYNAAQAHRLAGNKQRALTLYQSFVRMFPKSDDGSVQKHIAALKVAIEAEGKAEHAPPTDTRAPADRHEPPPGDTTHATPQPTVTAPTNPPPSTSPHTVDIVTKSPPPPPARKRTPAWVWGVTAGAVVVVAVGLGVGLGVGLSGTQYPSPSVGGARIP